MVTISDQPITASS